MRISDWSSDVCSSDLAAFLYQLFVREFGTNNFPDCSNMCHEPSGTGMTPQIGVGKGTVSLHDFELADAIFIFGQNPGTNHPRMLGELRRASKRGAAIASRSEEHTSELQSLMRISYAVFCLKKKNTNTYLHKQH